MTKNIVPMPNIKAASASISNRKPLFERLRYGQRVMLFERDFELMRCCV